MAELADAQDLKSWVAQAACGFDSRPRHQLSDTTQRVYGRTENEPDSRSHRTSPAPAVQPAGLRQQDHLEGRLGSSSLVRPFRSLSVSVPTPEAERLFLESFTTTRERFRDSLNASRVRDPKVW